MSMRRRRFLQSIGAATAVMLPSHAWGKKEVVTSVPPDVRRTEWVDRLAVMAGPVLTSLAGNTLREQMPVETRIPELQKARRTSSHLEAFGRLLCGIAPWLELPPDASAEGKQRERFFTLVQTSLQNAVDPRSPDLLNFSEGTQPLVDAAFLALALIRSPGIWKAANTSTKTRLLDALRSTRSIKPHFNNWLLFSAMIEAFFCSIDEQYDVMRIDYALRQHEQWYKGDGIFGDGPEFHWDYYNSYVIQPFMRTILDVILVKDRAYAGLRERFDKIAARYAIIQERSIAQDGTFPAIGRSIVYRCGAFHHLANESYLKRLPRTITPAQVRSALSAVMSTTLDRPDTYDARGWLLLGLSGHQPELAEDYISTGSLYLAATAFLPLGLPPQDEFWTAPTEDWTARKIWSGVNMSADSALKSTSEAPRDKK